MPRSHRWGPDAGRTFQKPDLGHTDTISITVRVRPASRNAMNPGSSAFWRSESPVPLRPAGVRQETELHDQLKLSGVPLGRRERGIYAIRPGVGGAGVLE
jgi:hypothetical protein